MSEAKHTKCACRFGSLGPAAFGFCQRCGCRHDGGDGAAGAKFDAWTRGKKKKPARKAKARATGLGGEAR